MKRLLPILLTIVLSINFGYSQTDLEKKKIIESYDQTKITSLKQSISERQKQKSDRIEQFLEANKNFSKTKEINGKSYQIFDIIDNNPVYQTTENIESAEATRTNFLHNGGGLGLNLEGQNMTIGVWDEDHALETHVEFLDNSAIPVTRVSTPDFVFGSTYGDHGTHVSGTLIAKGTDSDAKGMAPQASLVSYDWDNDSGEVLTEVSNNALLISNHSYGIPVFLQSGAQNAPTWMMGCYDSNAVEWDNVAVSNPYYLQVVSAGNDGAADYSGGLLAGYDKLTGNKNCKNNLVVANANNPSVLPNGDLLSLAINASSSQGPSDDGRIKPDITGDGTNLLSPISTGNSAYGIASGTSMSSPNVAGSLILLQQYYNSLNSQYMKSSTLKGLVCHTADDDSQKAGPDPIFGWGLLNSKTAAEVILDNSTGDAKIQELNLLESETYSTTFTNAGGGPISVTICWTDPAGADQSGLENSSTPALVNDLDVILRDPGGFVIHFPWKLALFNIDGVATTGVNNVDTVEKIDIDTSIAGTYTVEVSHKGTLTNSSQDFSLIVTGSNLTLGTEDNLLEDFAIWPNPTNGILHYTFNAVNNYDTSVTLIDIQGRTVFNNLLNTKNQLVKGTINTETFSKGVYFLKIKQGNALANKKVIIK